MDLDEIAEEELLRLIERLEYRAFWKMRGRHWLGVRGGTAPGGVEPADIVQAALTKMLDGTRPRNPVAYPSLEDQLRGVVDSEISALVQRSENSGSRDSVEWVGAVGSDPESRVEQAELATRVFSLMEEWAFEKDDVDLLAAVELFRSRGLDKPGEFMRELDLTRTKANNLKRRLRDALKAAQSQLEVDDG